MRSALLLVALAACKDDPKPAKKPDSPWLPLAGCGLAADPPAGWTLVDPALIGSGSVPEIEDIGVDKPSECRAAMTSPGGMTIVMAFGPLWDVHDHRFTVTGDVRGGYRFDDFVELNHAQLREHVLSREHDTLALDLGDEYEIDLTVAKLAPGLIESDQRDDVLAFGGARVWDLLHFMVAVHGTWTAYDSAALAEGLQSVGPTRRTP